MNKIKLLFVIIGVYIGANTLVYLYSGARTEIISQLATTFFPLLAGLLIGAVGVFLGSLGNLYSLITIQDIKYRIRMIDNISIAVREVRQDTLFVVISCGSVFLLYFLRGIDVPGISWPITISMLSKDIVYDSVIVSISALSYYAIYDCVKSMFTLHYHYEEIIKNNSK